MDDASLAKNLSELLSMGFDDTDALDALLKTNSLEGAIDYLFNKAVSEPIPNFVENPAPSPSFTRNPFELVKPSPTLQNPQVPLAKPPILMPQTISQKNPSTYPSNFPVPPPKIPSLINHVDYSSSSNQGGSYAPNKTLMMPPPPLSGSQHFNPPQVNPASNPPKFPGIPPFPLTQNKPGLGLVKPPALPMPGISGPPLPYSHSSLNFPKPPSSTAPFSNPPGPYNSDGSSTSNNLPLPPQLDPNKAQQIHKPPNYIPFPPSLAPGSNILPSIPVFPTSSAQRIPLPVHPNANLPNAPGGLSKLPSFQPPGLPSPLEDYKTFLRNQLISTGLTLECIDEIVDTCFSKEEALLILGIPTYYKDTPLASIPTKINAAPTPSSTNSQIKLELMKDGVDEETAELLSQSCNSLEEAYANLEDPYQQYETSHLPHPPLPLPSMFPHQNPFPSHPSHYPKNPYKSKIPPKPYQSKLPHYPSKYPMDSYSSDDDSLNSSLGYSNPFMAPFGRHSTGHSTGPPILLKEPSPDDPVAPDSVSNYFTSLKAYRLTMSESSIMFSNFSLNEQVTPSNVSLKRINAEIKALSTSVPCDSSASIFVMFDSVCMHRVQFLLSGTIDTPYAHGLYLFEALLPSNYPANPPKVQIATTGNGNMRFNPNLYSSGKVCLSVINTWQGRPEEMWNPSSSTLLQVMVSIQSLVMDNEIIQKEPSFERQPRDSAENIGYQWEVKYGNIRHAMIDMIKHPPRGFEEVVKEHFRIKKKEILETTEKWALESRGVKRINSGSQNPGIHAVICQKGLGNTFNELHSELQGMLNRYN